mmetsp:Transcript_48033/g.104595  ORF Transcript_48033/g.104595 Transcript_48033/m.104595 type:complete len:202 (+) Transcript_48033:89-694(+)
MTWVTEAAKLLSNLQAATNHAIWTPWRPRRCCSGIRLRLQRRCLLGLRRPHHPVVQETVPHRSVIDLQGVDLSEETEEDPGVSQREPDPEPGGPDADPDGVPPGRQRPLRPIIDLDVFQSACADHVLLVLVEGDEEGMAPLRVHKVQCLPLLGIERRHGVALAPRCDDQIATRLQHPDHFLDILLLVWHVLTRFAAPDEIE